MSKSPEAKKRKRENYKKNRRERLRHADLSTWRLCNEYHYQKTIGGYRVDWWPSASKCRIADQNYHVMDETDMVTIINSLPKKDEPNVGTKTTQQ
jgi:hypothetical protein